jgi:phosphatidylserine/phosphatidylglycerophosphate/cardiolipin synthase-like enzyme
MHPLTRFLFALILSNVIAGVAFIPQIAIADQPLLVPMTAVFDEIAHAKTITICVFTLSPHGKMATMLEDAARRGARVSVTFDSKAFGDAETMNSQVETDFQNAGVRVHMSPSFLHLKAAVFDGERIYLSDKNFATRGNELVLADPYPEDRLLVERAMLGVPGSNEHLWLRKADALNAEASIVKYGDTHQVDIQTESFGDGQPVYDAMIDRARAGDRVRLLVYSAEYRKNTREQAVVASLLRIGVQVRVADTNEKLAVNGQRSFVGSANQTRGLPNQIDFGYYVGDPAATTQIEQHFQENWDAASPA